ncbi:aldolase/citrate lyase family protein [Devosia sp. 2618]|uniref:HpcH/HpaI aldolase family protein n=1 Tax=Devosia sp. 2618 TaxID=3156454 RepID=UPI003397961C
MRQSQPSLKARLSAGETILAAFLFLPSPDVAEIMALAGFGALIVDREHIAADMESALHQLRAIRSVSDVPVLVRVRDHGEGSIKPLLDAGFDGIVAANVQSAEAARQLVANCHYPPLGRRGAHYTVSRAARYGMDAQTYPQQAADTLVIAMIESANGVAAIEDIAAVDGIDMLFLGPLDLAGDFGSFGDLGHKDLLATLDAAAARIKATGTHLGGALVPTMPIAQAKSAGYRLITAQSDIGLLRTGAASFLAGQA